MSIDVARPVTMGVTLERWPLIAPFHITGHVWEEVEVVLVTLECEDACNPQKLESNPEKGSRGRQCLLVMESSEDRIGTYDVGFSAAMARSRSGNRDCWGSGIPGPNPIWGRPRL
jgi:hypothetical protein